MKVMDTDWRARLRENVARVRAALAAACDRGGRPPGAVRLVAVTKYVGVEVIRELRAAGVTDIGESYVQQLVERAEELGGSAATGDVGWASPTNPPDAPRWHMIGHLQRNKVKTLLPHARILHSLDSARLAAAVQAQADELDVQVDAFLEVNVAGEASKQGIAPADAPGLVEAVRAFPRLRLRGLMTMAPYDPDPERSRPCFRRLRELLERLRGAGAVGPECVHLSMGMSQDYVVAAEEGATFVRVGSALFEGLPSTDPRG